MSILRAVAALSLVLACSDAPAPSPSTIPPAKPPVAAGAIGTAAPPSGATASPLQPSAPPPMNASLAPGVRIAEVALFQGTKTTIAKGGQRVATAARQLPVIAGRDALVRVYVETGPAPRTLVGELYVVRGGVAQVARDRIVVAGASREEDQGTTFDFELPGSLVQADAGYLVRVLDEAAPPVATTASNPAQYPPTRALELLEVVPTPKLRIVLVPIRYGADGSNRTPDLGPAMLDQIRKRALEFFPVAEVELIGHAPLAWNAAVNSQGAGWEELLTALTQLRLTESAPADAYYYGVLQPAPTGEAFCGSGGCLLGLSNGTPDPMDVGGRTSLGVFYGEPIDLETLSHELGHAHGQAHAPCDTQDQLDPAFPYPGGRAGAWGYSIVTKELKPPTLFDQMGYCVPAWQSDHVYRAFFNRGRSVAGRRLAPGRPRTYRMLKVAADGTLDWSGEPFTTSAAISAAPQTVQFVDDAGTVVAEDEAQGYTFSHLPGGFFVVPTDVPARWSRLRIDLRRRATEHVFAPLHGRVGAAIEVALR